MKKFYPTLLLTLILCLSFSKSYAQGPGSLFVDAGPDVTIDCATGGCADITATFLETFDTSGLTYTVNSIPYNPPFPFNGLANPLNPNIDDAWSPVDNLPFDFCFFGNLETQFQVGSNGVLRFDVNAGDTSNGWSFDVDLPSNTPDAIGEANVFTPVHDIDPSVSSSEEIGYEVLGTFPNRVLVVSYYEVPMYSSSCNNLLATQMAVFYEFSNVIEIYIQDKPSCPSWNSGNAAIGIQNDAGDTAYVPPGRNTSDSPWTATNEAWSFSPVGPPTYVFEWLDSSGTVIGTTPTINVCPTGSETYTARVTWTNTCNGETVTLTDDVVVTQSAPFTVDLGPDINTCETTPIVLDASADTPPGVTYEWFYNTVSQAPPSTAATTFTVLAPNSGTYSVEVIDPTDPTCIVNDSIDINFYTQPYIDSTPNDLFICDDGATPGLFDLTVNEPIIFGPQNPANFNVFYFDGTGTPIAIPNSYLITGTNETITVRIEDLSGNCFVETTFEINFSDAVAGFVGDYTLCDQDGTGDELIDLFTTFNITVLNGQPSSAFNISYHGSQADANSGMNPLPNPYNVIAPSQQIYIRFENAANTFCFDSTQNFTIFLDEPPVINDMPSPLVLCDVDNDGFAGFDLTLADGDITLGDGSLVVTYHGTLLDAQSGSLPLSSPYTNDAPYSDVPVTDPSDPAYGTGGVWARVESPASSCYGVAPLALEVRDSPVASTPAPLRLCDDAVADGFTFFDLTVSAPGVLGGLDPALYDLYWYVDMADAVAAGDAALSSPDFSQAIAVPTAFLNTSNPQTVYVLVVGNGLSTSPNNGTQGCYDIVPLELIVDPNPEDLGPFQMFLCDDQVGGSAPDDGVSTFDLTAQDPAATGGLPGLTVTWFETPADEAAGLPIADPTAYQNTATPQTVIGRVESQFGCRTLVTLTLTVLPNPTPNASPDPIELCDNADTTGDFDNGIASGFDPTVRDAEIIASEPDVSVAYYETPALAEGGVPGTEIVPPYTNTVPGSQTVYARVTRDTPPGVLPCYTVVPLELVVVALPDAPVAPEFRDPMLECDGDGDGTATFDLTLQDAGVYGAQDPAGFVPVTYYTSLADAEVPQNAIDPATAFPSAGQTVWARLESTATGCARVTPFELVVGAFPTAAPGNDLFECDDEASGDRFDGLSTFDLTVNGPVVNPNGEPGVAYYASAAQQAADDPITDPGAYQNEASPVQQIFVTVTNAEGCPATSSFLITVEPNPAPAEPAPLVACDDDNDGFYDMFDLASKDAEIANGEPDVTVAYYETALGAQAGDPADALASPYANIVPFQQTVYARVTRDTPPGVNPCHSVVPLQLVVELLPLPPGEGFGDLSACDDDYDGTAIFDLTLNDGPAIGDNQPAADFSVSYHTSLADAEVPQNAIDPATAFPSTGQTIWARVGNSATGCARITPFELTVGPLPVLGQGPFGITECQQGLEGALLTATFDLTQAAGDITGGNLSYSLAFYATPADLANGDPIADPTAYQNIQNPQPLPVRVLDGDCYVDTVLTIRVVAAPTPNEQPADLLVCDGDAGDVDGDGQDDDTDTGDGLSFFDLTLADADILDGENGSSVAYYGTQALAEAGDPADALASPYANTVPFQQTVYARVTKETPPAELPCYAVVPLQLVVSPLPDDTVEITDVTECQVPFTGADETILLQVKDQEVLALQDPEGDFEVHYFEDLAAAQAGDYSQDLAKDTPYAFGTGGTTLYVGIENLETGCYAASTEDPQGSGEYTLSFELTVKEGAQANGPEPYVICDNQGDNDGTGAFTLKVGATQTDLDPQAEALQQQILGGQDPLQFLITFHETPGDAETGENPLPDIYANIANPQVIYARVENTVDPDDAQPCYSTVPVTLKVELLPRPQLLEQYRICVDANGDPVPETAGDPSPPLLDTGLDPDRYTFLWGIDGQPMPNEVGPAVTALVPGQYSVTVTEAETGCQATATATVTISSPPVQYGATATSGAFAGEHVIEVTAEGPGQYVFQLDNGPFQDSPTFTGVEPGGHTVTISDANGCGSVTIEVGIVDYPRFMTPNGDGYHDTWNIIGIAQADPAARIYIFDRNGKLLKQISPTGNGWDGNYNGAPMPSSDYWFRVEYSENQQRKEFTGHFTIKR